MDILMTKHMVEEDLVAILHWWLIIEVVLVEIHRVNERIQLIFKFYFQYI